MLQKKSVEIIFAMFMQDAENLKKGVVVRTFLFMVDDSR